MINTSSIVKPRVVIFHMTASQKAPVVLKLTSSPGTRTAKSYPDLSYELANHVAGFLRIPAIAIGGS
jgi:hypothetical protein